MNKDASRLNIFSLLPNTRFTFERSEKIKFIKDASSECFVKNLLFIVLLSSPASPSMLPCVIYIIRQLRFCCAQPEKLKAENLCKNISPQKLVRCDVKTPIVSLLLQILIKKMLKEFFFVAKFFWDTRHREKGENNENVS